MTVIVKRFNNDADTAIAPVASASALPAGLIIAPGTYTTGGLNFPCLTEGLYRFWDPVAATSLQRIVYSSDVHALMSAIAWISVNGRADEALTVSAKTNKAVTSKLSMLCGKTCEWAKALCDSLGMQTRIVNCLTAGTPSGYYDGHVMLEVKVGGVWRLYDLANDATFGTLLPLKDALPLTSGITTAPLATDTYGIEAAVASQFDVTMWQEMTMRTPAQKRAEMERVLQIPGITHSDALTYFYLPTGMESRSSWVTGLSANYRVITQAAWLAMFYS